MSTRWYRTGTVTVTQGSVIVTGVDTQWTSQTVAGDLFTLDGSKIYEVASIESNTSLTLGSAITESSGSGLSYGIARNVNGRTTAELAGGVAQLIEEYESLADSAGGGKFSDGSVNAPGITFADDLNTGMYRIGTDNIGIACNATKILDIGTTGVAVGAATGGKKAAGTVNATGYYLNGTDISAATTSAAGLVELATDAETQIGTDTTRVVTPASLKSAVPFKTTAAMNLYVNSGAAYGSYGAGSDSNAGTQAAPLATIAAAIAKIPKFLEHAVTITLAGESNYYEWKPDGTNGIKFTTGDSGVTVAVVSGSTLSVAISGSAVTITLATGGSTIFQIWVAINASPDVAQVIYPIQIGTASTNITATLSAQSLTGGNVRIYDAVTLGEFAGKAVTVTGGSADVAGVIVPGVIGTNTRINLSYFTIAPNNAAATGISIDKVTGTFTALRTATEHSVGLSCTLSQIRVTACVFHGAVSKAFYSTYGSLLYLQSSTIGGAVGISTYGALAIHHGCVNVAATPTSANPAGSIIG